MAAFDLSNGEKQESARTQQPRNETLSHQPQKSRPLPSLEYSDAGVWDQATQRDSIENESKQKGPGFSSGNASARVRYNLDLPSVFRKKAGK